MPFGQVSNCRHCLHKLGSSKFTARGTGEIERDLGIHFVHVPLIMNRFFNETGRHPEDDGPSQEFALSTTLRANAQVLAAETETLDQRAVTLDVDVRR